MSELGLASRTLLKADSSASDKTSAAIKSKFVEGGLEDRSADADLDLKEFQGLPEEMAGGRGNCSVQDNPNHLADSLVFVHHGELKSVVAEGRMSEFRGVVPICTE